VNRELKRRENEIGKWNREVLGGPPRDGINGFTKSGRAVTTHPVFFRSVYKYGSYFF
jgi:hypothetical protein